MLDFVKRRLKKRIREVVERLHPEQLNPYGDSFWYSGPNLWEPPVQTALKDLCRQGATVFDVGANLGGLTSAMSRLVGPRGMVCSFEASPRIFGYLQGNIIKQGHNNVTAYHCAVYSRSNERVKIYPGDHLNDSIYDYGHGRSGEFYWVNTVSLDNFCAETGLVPSVVKMDIEGAEFDALNGAADLITEHRPHLILEQQPNDTRCLDFLKCSGYQALDLNAYRLIDSAADYPSNVGIRNVLFVHPTRSGDLAYQLPPRVDEVAELRANDFLKTGNTFASSAPMRLGVGRYLMEVFFAASGTTNELMCGVRLDGQTAFRYHGYSKLIADSYRDWVVDVTRDAEIQLYFDFINGTFDDSFVLSGARIQRLAGFLPSTALQFLMP
jgi:FkbM family methyltransferase